MAVNSFWAILQSVVAYGMKKKISKKKYLREEITIY